MTIEDLVKDLHFMSEGDGDWQVKRLAARKPQTQTIDCRQLRALLERKDDSLCEPLDFVERFEHWILRQEQSDRYKTLRDWLLKNWIMPRVFRVAAFADNYNMAYLVVGYDGKSGIIAIYVNATETLVDKA